MEPWKFSNLSPLSLALSSSISSTLFCSHFRCRKNWESIPVEFLQLYARTTGEGEGVGPPVLLEFGAGGCFQDIYVTAAVTFQPQGSLAGWLRLFQILSPNTASLGYLGKYREPKQEKRKIPRATHPSVTSFC